MTPSPIIADCPICGPLLEDINSSQTFMDLRDIRMDLYRKGLTDAQRRELQAAIVAKEDELGRRAGI